MSLSTLAYTGMVKMAGPAPHPADSIQRPPKISDAKWERQQNWRRSDPVITDSRIATENPAGSPGASLFAQKPSLPQDPEAQGPIDEKGTIGFRPDLVNPGYAGSNVGQWGDRTINPNTGKLYQPGEYKEPGFLNQAGNWISKNPGTAIGGALGALGGGMFGGGLGGLAGAAALGLGGYAYDKIGGWDTIKNLWDGGWGRGMKAKDNWQSLDPRTQKAIQSAKLGVGPKNPGLFGNAKWWGGKDEAFQTAAANPNWSQNTKNILTYGGKGEGGEAIYNPDLAQGNVDYLMRAKAFAEEFPEAISTLAENPKYSHLGGSISGLSLDALNKMSPEQLQQVQHLVAPQQQAAISSIMEQYRNATPDQRASILEVAKDPEGAVGKLKKSLPDIQLKLPQKFNFGSLFGGKGDNKPVEADINPVEE